MSTSFPTNLEATIRHAGEGWLIDWFAPPEDAMDHIRETLEAVQQEARQRLGDDAPDLSETALMQEYQRNPLAVRGFFQALGGTRTPAMLLMTWRIIQGMEVRDVRLAYHRQRSFEMQVILEAPSGQQDAPYVSQNVHDFALFRHIGIMEIDGAPVFGGFYALKVR